MTRIFGFICALAAAAPGVAQAQPAAYAGKTITLIVGYKPGGGYDATARLLARHLPKHIPGSPTVIVQNMPGGNSIIAANHVYNSAKPDGLTLATFNRNLPVAQLTRVQGVKFDITKYAWVGSAANEVTVLTVRADLPYRSLEELRKAPQPLVIGANGPGASNYDFPLLLKELLGINLKIVSGYMSSADIMLAVERKEVDGRAGSYTSMRPFIERGLVRPILRARSTEAAVAQLPVDENFAPTAQAKAILALRSAPEVIARPFVMPPRTPEEFVRIMRQAFARAIADPQLLAEAKKAGMDVAFTPAEEALKVMRDVLAQPRDIVDEFSKYVKFGE